MLYFLYILIAIVGAIGLIGSIVIRKKQRDRTYDKGLNNTTAKHKFLANPIFISYALLTIVALSMIALMMLILGDE